MQIFNLDSIRSFPYEESNEKVLNGCLITEPALISMKSEDGARLVGIQINKN